MSSRIKKILTPTRRNSLLFAKQRKQYSIEFRWPLAHSIELLIYAVQLLTTPQIHHLG